MSESLPTISPYLNPEYWEGNMLGAGQPEPFPRFKGDLHSARIAAGALSAVMGRLHLSESQRDLSAQQMFTSDDYRPGTVVLLRQETLFAAGKIPDLLETELEPVTQTKDPSDFSLKYAPFDVPSRAGAWHNIVYHDHLVWGVVAETKKGATVLETVADDKIVNGDHRTVGMASLPICHDSQFTIGQTNHRRQEGRRPIERLERVNAIKIVASVRLPGNDRIAGKRIGKSVLPPASIFGL